MDALTKETDNLGNLIRTIEKESGKVTQLIAQVGDERYLVGDLTQRQGRYQIEMDKTYVHHGGLGSGPCSVPNQELAGEYDSFDAIKEAIKRTPKFDLKGIKESVFVLQLSYGKPRFDGDYYVVGRVITPLLQEDEQVKPVKLP